MIYKFGSHDNRRKCSNFHLFQYYGAFTQNHLLIIKLPLVYNVYRHISRSCGGVGGGFPVGYSLVGTMYDGPF